MRIFEHSFVVRCNIEKVWAFYTKLSHLKIITPKSMNLEILESNSEIIKEGSEARFKARLITNSKWHSRITYLKPYKYVDEMLSGRFKVWRHSHKFVKINEDETEVVDKIEYELPFGFMGAMFENYVDKSLLKIFKYRKDATISTLEKDLQV